MQLEDLARKAQHLERRSRFLAQSQYSGLYRSAFRGQGIEFSEVREYSEGDDIRLVDWNVSARNQTLYIKKMIEERDRNVLLLVDTSASLGFGSVRRTKFDLLQEIASLFVLAGFYARDRVSLALYGERVESYFPPRKGWNHAVRLIREMVSVSPAGSGKDLEPVWHFLNSPGIRRSLVLILTDFEAPLTVSNRLSVAARKHEILCFLTSDPREWELPKIGRVRLRDPETGRVRLVDTGQVGESFRSRAAERRQSLTRVLSGTGIDWVEFSTGTDYEVPLRRFLEVRSTRRGCRRR